MDIEVVIKSLSPMERKVIPLLNSGNMEEIVEKSALDRVSVLRALEFLNAKKAISLKLSKEKVVDLGVNGIHYKKSGLPERRLIQLLEKGIYSLQNAQKDSKLSQNEFRAALGALKKRAMIGIKNGKLFLTAKKEELVKKTLEEQFIESLPLNFDNLAAEQKFAFNTLKERKNILEIEDKQVVSFEILPLGKELIKADLSKADKLIEEITPEMIKNSSWKGKEFRIYDLTSKVPEINGGKRHFVNQAIDYGRKIWSEMGFKEMSGDLLQSSFWNFDVLFTAQDHPVREMQDTFFLDNDVNVKDKALMNKIKKAHESGIKGSKGWQYSWDENKAKQLAMRTHTTPLSVQTLSKLNVKDLPKKFFAIGKCFRNETVDWSHGFEFNQTEGIVVDRDANFSHLLGYLKEFFTKMGFSKIRFQPAYFPYTEPSVEIYGFHEGKKTWIELGGAGIFRPEVVVPIFGKYIPVLAWGPGFDRTLMDYYKIKDLRELYKNDLNQLRKIKFWNK